ncbi:MAG: DNA adenine methylase [Lachnospiraceae bacterium]|nr:DNA adenine methylase [Lachnospiraceae bacterium]
MSFKKMGPFVKWAGGKGQLLDRIQMRIPDNFNSYYEPFIGGGAVLLGVKPSSAVINDTNEQLINVYRQLKNDPRAVIRAVNQLDQCGKCDKDFYLETRNLYNEKIKKHELDAECAGLMIWINKHCFNGLYRVNSKGLFNVPYNNKQLGKSIDEANLMSIGYYLSHSNVEILCSDFEDACEKVKKGDFVYFDSPYVPVSETASFTDYTKDGFGYEDHKRLAELFRRLDGLGAKVMLSNHDVQLVHELYDGYNIECVDVKRNINSDAKKRSGKEVIITNYKI